MVVIVKVDIATLLQCSIYYHYTTTTLYQFNLFRMNSTNAVSSRAQRPILKKNWVLYLSDKFWYSRDRYPDGSSVRTTGIPMYNIKVVVTSLTPPNPWYHGIIIHATPFVAVQSTWHFFLFFSYFQRHSLYFVIASHV